MDIVRFSRELHLDAVERFNRRIASRSDLFQFPLEEPVSEPRSSITREHYVVADGGDVLGGYLIKYQQYWIHGIETRIGNLGLPLSLGLIDNAYASVGPALLLDALRRSPLLYCLGMGSQERNVVRLLKAANWQGLTVPFHFRIRSANRFARNIRLPADKSQLQLLLRLAGHARLAAPLVWLRGLMGQKMSRGPRARGTYETAKVVPHFGDVEDRLFAAHSDRYSIVGDRRAATANCLYPARSPTFIRLVVRRSSQVIGWVLLLDTQMSGHKYFGDMRVGSIADCYAAPTDARAVVAAADDFLSERKVDIIVSNQMHAAWCDALHSTGYQQGSSNFFFYFSAAIADLLTQGGEWESKIHVNRGDGDGPINL